LQAETLKRELSNDEANKPHLLVLDKISNQLNKLSELVKNLRKLFNSRNYHFNEVELQPVCDEILEIIKPSLKSKKIRFIKQFTSNPRVLADSIQLQQVLINLFNNAIDAIEHSTSAVKEIRLTIATEDQWAVVSVEDSGCGIDEHALPHLFELYKTTKKDGLGIGLWLSKTILEKHQGTIHAANRPEGGAVFTFRIPLISPSHE